MATINGTNSADSLYGTSAGDIINGLNGNDTLKGFGGADSSPAPPSRVLSIFRTMHRRATS
jgi:RTX calcium-binding nonapeptide repeat (4 copies)